MLGHARWLLWEGWAEFQKNPAEYSLLNKFLVYFFSLFIFGHESVLFFFVLSGFVIHLKYARAIKIDSGSVFDFFDFARRRVKRLYPPLIFAIIITIGLDYLGHSLGYTIYQKGTPNLLINRTISYNLDFSTILGNLLFLQIAYTPVVGSNWPLWSLMYEGWFYLCYPFLFILSRKKPIYPVVVTLFFAIWAILNLPFPMRLMGLVFSYLFSWYLGCFLADVYIGRIRISLLWLSTAAFAFPAAMFFEKRISNHILVDTLTALSVMGLLSYCLWLNERSTKWLRPIIRLKWLGSFSFTLYLIHFPIITFCNGFILSRSGNIFPSHLMFALMASVLCLGIAYLVHFLVERPFTGKASN